MRTPSSGSGLKTITVIVAVIFGLVLLIGGIWLAVLGGSWYYIIAGLFFIATAVLLQKFSVHDKFHRTLILSGFCLLKIAKISLNSSFFPKPIKR